MEQLLTRILTRSKVSQQHDGPSRRWSLQRRRRNVEVRNGAVFRVRGLTPIPYRFHRAVTRPFFSRDRITLFNIFDTHAEEAIAKMKERLREGYSVDFQDLISRFTLDSATDFLFGQNVHSLSSQLPYPKSSGRPAPPPTPADAFATAFLQAQVVAGDREKRGWTWPLWEMWRDGLKEPMKVVSAYVDPIVQEVVRKHKERVKAGQEPETTDKLTEAGEGETLLEHLVKTTSGKLLAPFESS